jgi:RNA polymerase sigma factor (sigma-70 family)
MRATENELLQRLKTAEDSDAFSLAVTRYADLVYSTCYRILGNDAKAEDVTQETFFQLFKKADSVTDCLGGWLHRVATHRCLDVIRQDAARRRRERAYVIDSETGANSWAQVEPLVDQALDQLPEDLRQVLLAYYLQQKSTVQIAADIRMSQPTVSRRLAQGLEMVRTHLRNSGVVVGVVPLQGILLHSAELAPQSVLCKLGKMALTYAASAKTAASVSTVAIGVVAKVALVGATVAVVALLVQEPSPAPQTPTVAIPSVSVQRAAEPPASIAVTAEKSAPVSPAMAEPAKPVKPNPKLVTKFLPQAPRRIVPAVERPAVPKDPTPDSPGRMAAQEAPTLSALAPLYQTPYVPRLRPNASLNLAGGQYRRDRSGVYFDYVPSTNGSIPNLARVVSLPLRFQPSGGLNRPVVLPQDARANGGVDRR